MLHAQRKHMKMLLLVKWWFEIAVWDRRLVLSADDLSGEIYTGLLEPPG